MRFIFLFIASFIFIGCSAPENLEAKKICSDLEGLDNATLTLLEGKPLVRYGKVGDGPYAQKMFHELLSTETSDFYWCNYQLKSPDTDYDSVELIFKDLGISNDESQERYRLILWWESTVLARGGTLRRHKTEF